MTGGQIMVASVLGLILAPPPLLWIFYLIVMKLKDARADGKLSPVGLQIAFAVLMIGYVIDATCNVLSASLMFLDPPKELTVTARVQRYVNGADGWRRTCAWWVAVVLLNPYSRTPHIALPTDRPAPAGFFTSGISQ